MKLGGALGSLVKSASTLAVKRAKPQRRDGARYAEDGNQGKPNRAKAQLAALDELKKAWK